MSELQLHQRSFTVLQWRTFCGKCGDQKLSSPLSLSPPLLLPIPFVCLPCNRTKEGGADRRWAVGGMGLCNKAIITK